MTSVVRPLAAAREQVLHTFLRDNDDVKEDLQEAIFLLAFIFFFIKPTTERGTSISSSQLNDQPIQRWPRTASRAYCKEILKVPDPIFFNLFHMKKAVFFNLCQWLNINAGICSSRCQSLEQKVMIFLYRNVTKSLPQVYRFCRFQPPVTPCLKQQT